MKIRFIATISFFLMLSATCYADLTQEKSLFWPWSVSGRNPAIEEKIPPKKANPYETKTSPAISLVWMIKFYKLTSSSNEACTFYPTCSEYAGQAILKHGFLLGLIMSAERIMRYHHDISHYDLIGINDEYRLYDPLELNDFWF